MSNEWAKRPENFMLEIFLCEHDLNHLTQKASIIIAFDKLFNEVDTDDDKIITAADLKRAWPQVNGINDVQNSEWFKFMDVDDSGLITREKWRAFVMKIANMDETCKIGLRQWFKNAAMNAGATSNADFADIGMSWYF
uniref:EF-hand domain-containing protein n=1 Tax=Favella ehrenbergii TaxID=182087 RepID=A0A7S3I2K1_9SPIT|mmetsp:Transcript_30696/g.37980  ORF Transcript_30696/g.37980 Transcript_30696/m.37980 type:complete len:138 (+) Transcript_30696:193-606(+)|eukprot:CAMPEP_0170466344 /NCGR_PEP_ID=MMETSP0123-20130129/10338_1 /TAXON_ID=182087 /ORGANISM="Favella ehrenbergii, Strain Fehren 1" /LENGTH=137 /DNA_ID=CAMNT_0010732447 /DNA_START=272 /DNA_END=685 /DNA_ORIENTATION=-